MKKNAKTTGEIGGPAFTDRGSCRMLRGVVHAVRGDLGLAVRSEGEALLVVRSGSLGHRRPPSRRTSAF
ncbi:MAG TPA: hypothetical protein DFS52_30715 [Myxococcales bacterium]|nr:hypothetical protein [Myxococcales bacterium]